MHVLVNQHCQHTHTTPLHSRVYEKLDVKFNSILSEELLGPWRNQCTCWLFKF